MCGEGSGGSAWGVVLLGLVRYMVARCMVWECGSACFAGCSVSRGVGLYDGM